MLCFNFSSCSGKQLRNLKLYPFNVKRESASKDTHSKKKKMLIERLVHVLNTELY